MKRHIRDAAGQRQPRAYLDTQYFEDPSIDSDFSDPDVFSKIDSDIDVFSAFLYSGNIYFFENDLNLPIRDTDYLDLPIDEYPVSSWYQSCPPSSS